jgi:hypothetical protein
MHLPKTFTFCTGLPAMDEDEFSVPLEDSGFREPEDAGCEPDDSTPALDVGSSPEENAPDDELSSPPVTGAVDDESSPQAARVNESAIAAAAEATVAKIEFFFMDSSFSIILTLLNINLKLSKVNSLMQQKLNFLNIFQHFQ